MRRALSSKLPPQCHRNHFARQYACYSVNQILGMADETNDGWVVCSRKRVLTVHRSFVQKAEEKVEKVTGKH